MRLEPDINRQCLKDHLARIYGISVDGLLYVPQGEVSYNYVVRSRPREVGQRGQEDGPSYVLKLLDASRLAGLAVERMRVALPLLEELRRRDLLVNVPQPVFTKSGAPMGRFGEFDVVLLVYVPGDNPDPVTLHRPDIWAQLARHVASLHNATHLIETGCPFVETYALPFEGDLVASMRELRGVTGGVRKGVRDLRDLLLSRSEALTALLLQTKQLASVARRLASPPVLCHTDIHAMNLVIDDRDALTLLDWEGIKLAPAEHDLFAFTGADFPAFLETYWAAGGVRRLHAEVFGYYFYRRNLEDLTDWLVRILYENRDSAQDDLDLAGLQSECLEGWADLGPATERVRNQLRSLGV